MQKSMSFILAMAITGCCSLNLCAQTSKSNEVFVEMLKSENKDISEETVTEIMAIRKRLGGGLGLNETDWFKLPDSKIANVVESDSRSAKIFRDAMTNLPPTVSFEHGSVEKLRRVARKMDDLAADLEDLDLFDDADQIRMQAAKIRGQARKVKTVRFFRR